MPLSIPISLIIHLFIFTIYGLPIKLSYSQDSSASSPSTSVIKVTKVTPFYWRATFSDPPLNIQGDAFFRDFYTVVDQITNDSSVKVVVFDSSSDTFFSNHVDLVGSLDHNLWPGNSRYWDSITRLAKSPVLTVAAIKGIAQNAGAEIAAVLDVRFASKEKAAIGQLEVGFGM